MTVLRKELKMKEKHSKEKNKLEGAQEPIIKVVPKRNKGWEIRDCEKSERMKGFKRSTADSC